MQKLLVGVADKHYYVLRNVGLICSPAPTSMKKNGIGLRKRVMSNGD